MHRAFQMLGLRSSHAELDPRVRRQLEDADFRLEIMEGLDLLYDHALAPFFPQLADAWPDAGFIYTVRDEDSWIRSLQKVDYLKEQPRKGSHVHYGRAVVYGCIAFHEERYRYVFRTHDRLVRDYFTGPRADRLLILDLNRGDGFEQLCPFLGLPVPDVAYPHVNKGGTVVRGKPSLKRRLQRRIREIVD